MNSQPTFSPLTSVLSSPGLAAPRAGFVLDYLDWGTKGYGDKFRTATVVLPGLILIYYMIFLLIELINLTFVVVLMIFGLVKVRFQSTEV